MKAAAVTVHLILAFRSAPQHRRSGACAPDINLSAFANGALLENASSEYGDTWQRAGDRRKPDNGWSSEKARRVRLRSFSTAESSEIGALEFDTASTDSPRARSERHRRPGFRHVGHRRLRPADQRRRSPAFDRQHFNLAKPASARWIKLVVKSNHGDPDSAN